MRADSKSEPAKYLNPKTAFGWFRSKNSVSYAHSRKAPGHKMAITRKLPKLFRSIHHNRRPSIDGNAH